MGYGQVNVGGTKVIDDTLANMTNFDEMADLIRSREQLLGSIINNSTGRVQITRGDTTYQRTYISYFGVTFKILKDGRYRVVEFRDGNKKISDNVFTYSANQTIATNACSLILIYHLTD